MEGKLIYVKCDCREQYAFIEKQRYNPLFMNDDDSLYEDCEYLLN